MTARSLGTQNAYWRVSQSLCPYRAYGSTTKASTSRALRITCHHILWANHKRPRKEILIALPKTVSMNYSQKYESLNTKVHTALNHPLATHRYSFQCRSGPTELASDFRHDYDTCMVYAARQNGEHVTASNQECLCVYSSVSHLDNFFRASRQELTISTSPSFKWRAAVAELLWVSSRSDSFACMSKLYWASNEAR
jgi:hypothetical protein